MLKANQFSILNMNQISAFLRVVETGSFSSAATELSLSRSAVSKLVGQLEEKVGVLLISRTTRRLTLTDAGATFHVRCSGIANELSSAVDEIRDNNNQLQGMLRIHSSLGVGQRVIAPLLLQFMKRYPRISIALSLGEVPVGNMVPGSDMMISLKHKTDPSAKSLCVDHLSEVKFLVCAAPDYLGRHGQPATVDDLKQHNCLIHEGHRAARQWRFRNADGSIKAIGIAGSFSTNSAVSLEMAVLEGVGVGRVPDYVARDHIQSGRLITLFDNVVAWGEVISVYTAIGQQTSRARALLSFLQEELNSKENLNTILIAAERPKRKVMHRERQT